MTVVVAPDQPYRNRQSTVASSRRCWVARLRSCCGALTTVTPSSLRRPKQTVKPDFFHRRAEPSCALQDGSGRSSCLRGVLVRSDARAAGEALGVHDDHALAVEAQPAAGGEVGEGLVDRLAR